MTTAKPIDAAALAARILAFAADPASGMMPAQTRILRALATRLADLTHVSPSALVLAWGEARSTTIKEDYDALANGSPLPDTVEAATLREMVDAVCEKDFADAAREAMPKPQAAKAWTMAWRPDGYGGAQ